MGQKVVDLKEPHREVLTVKPSPLEQILTRFIEQRFQDLRLQRKKKTLARDDPLYELGNMLQQITRLRQSVKIRI